MEIKVNAPRGALGEILRAVERGEEVVVLRKGRAVGRMIPDTRPAVASESACPRLPDLSAFRESIKCMTGGTPLSETVIGLRAEERF